jgi:hypothetical protein
MMKLLASAAVIMITPWSTPSAAGRQAAGPGRQLSLRLHVIGLVLHPRPERRGRRRQVGSVGGWIASGSYCAAAGVGGDAGHRRAMPGPRAQGCRSSTGGVAASPAGALGAPPLARYWLVCDLHVSNACSMQTRT